MKFPIISTALVTLCALTATAQAEIKIASVREYDYLEAKRNEEELHQISFSYDAMAVVKKMKQMVPEFKSQHSRYEVLD
mgnify:CR=1 FL=1